MRRTTRRAPWLSQCCYHVSHNSYSAARIFRFENMRKLAAERLRTLKDAHRIRILDYLLHPDGYRVLIQATHPGHVIGAMRSFHIGTTYDYCKRKNWEGPVWQRHASMTLVQTGHQALRCALDMDFQMVRSGDPDIFHPLLWKHSGHLELSDIRKRYRLTDRTAVRRCLMDVDWQTFREWYINASTDRWNGGPLAEEPWWTNALLVGSKQLCEDVADAFPRSSVKLNVYPPLQNNDTLHKTMAWTVNVSLKRRRQYIRSLVPEQPQRPPA